MPPVATRAIVLQSFRYSESSKILRLYTMDYGLRSGIAKGALRPRSRFAGVLEAFTEGEALLYLKRGRDLHTLGGFDLLRSRQRIGTDLGAFTGASLLAELVLRFGTEEPQPELFLLLSESLDALSTDGYDGYPERTGVAVRAAWSIVGLLGFRPMTVACVHCGRGFGPGEAVRFDAEAGGAACTGCRTGGRLLDAESRGELERMASGEELEAPLARPATHSALLRTFLLGQLGSDRPLRTLDLFLQQLNAGRDRSA